MSSFDPFGVYSRKPYYNRKAQIIRKKPVFHGGSVSVADLPYLEKKIKALGYKIDYGTTPRPPVPSDLEISEVVHSNINLSVQQGSSTSSISQSDVREGLLQMQVFDLASPPSSFTVIENIDWIGVQLQGSHGPTGVVSTDYIYLRCPHLNQTLGPQLVPNSSPAAYAYPTDMGLEFLSGTQVMFTQCESDNVLGTNLPQTLLLNKTDSPDNNSYTVGTKIYNGLEYYNMFKNGTGLSDLDNLIELQASFSSWDTFHPSRINLYGVMSIEVKYTL